MTKYVVIPYLEHHVHEIQKLFNLQVMTIEDFLMHTLTRLHQLSGVSIFNILIVYQLKRMRSSPFVLKIAGPVSKVISLRALKLLKLKYCDFHETNF